MRDEKESNFGLRAESHQEYSKRPPIGPKPRRIHDADRARELWRAIDECMAYNVPPRTDWVEELSDILMSLSEGPES